MDGAAIEVGVNTQTVVLTPVVEKGDTETYAADATGKEEEIGSDGYGVEGSSEGKKYRNKREGVFRPWQNKRESSCRAKKGSREAFRVNRYALVPCEVMLLPASIEQYSPSFFSLLDPRCLALWLVLPHNPWNLDPSFIPSSFLASQFSLSHNCTSLAFLLSQLLFLLAPLFSQSHSPLLLTIAPSSSTLASCFLHSHLSPSLTGDFSLRATFDSQSLVTATSSVHVIPPQVNLDYLRGDVLNMN
ncbi:hypothetical protein Cgig2_027011 [Carnegiea gigantea]|uniref:Uncharacterized protein n=1 Tax=Carnegiea gigantea TaxID=171969 RepID=A0A9Q1JSU5_9CARY|nr:hypothetical protein Cgig2_027011 [Carnegiea gigantea]